MVRAWYIKPSEKITNPKDPNHLDPPKYLNIDELKQRTGVSYWQIDADNYEKEGLLKKICDERGYSYMDEIVCSQDRLQDYDQKLRTFFTEHIHIDEEIRFVLEGKGFFDIRDNDDEWVRVEVNKNDLIVLPAGAYHRFTLDESDYIRVKRLFVGEPVWTAINRPAEDHPARQKYLEKVKAGF